MTVKHPLGRVPGRAITYTPPLPSSVGERLARARRGVDGTGGVGCTACGDSFVSTLTSPMGILGIGAMVAWFFFFRKGK